MVTSDAAQQGRGRVVDWAQVQAHESRKWLALTSSKKAGNGVVGARDAAISRLPRFG